MARLERLELVAIASLTALFLVIALINLGSHAIPSSTFLPAQLALESEADELEVVLDFGSVQQIGSLYLFCNDAKRSKFELYAREEDEQWRALTSYDNDPAKHVHFCSWERITLGNRSARALKLVFAPESDGVIGELLVLSAGHERLTPVAVQGEGAERLLDEQEQLKPPITQRYGAYFDEMYFVRTAQQHLRLEEPYEWVHPPLGKLIIALSILLFGMNPFGWRILGVAAAAAMIPLIYLMAKRLFKSSAAGFITAFLLTFEFMHFTVARLATTEVYLLLFSMAMFFFALEYFTAREENHEERKAGEKNRAATWLFLSLICFGLGFAVKWTAIFGLLALFTLLIAANLRSKKPLWYDGRIVLAGILFSGAIYIAAYLPYMYSGGGHALIDLQQLPLYLHYVKEYLATGTITVTPFNSLTVFDLQLQMFGYHAGLEATHPYSSTWWSWPLMLKPLWLYSNSLNGSVSTIVMLGNPVIWWSAIPALIGIGGVAVAARLKGRSDPAYRFVPLFILVPYLLQWLLYLSIPRILFIYHFLANVPFIILAVTYWLHQPFEQRWTASRSGLLLRVLVLAFLGAVIALFFIFYPVLSGYPVSSVYKEQLRWLPGWVF
jgi:4-amino-4-deoxy-L-arabinose transferase-like glycosyltransferase